MSSVGPLPLNELNFPQSSDLFTSTWALPTDTLLQSRLVSVTFDPPWCHQVNKRVSWPLFFLFVLITVAGAAATLLLASCSVCRSCISLSQLRPSWSSALSLHLSVWPSRTRLPNIFLNDRDAIACLRSLVSEVCCAKQATGACKSTCNLLVNPQAKKSPV